MHPSKKHFKTLFAIALLGVIATIAGGVFFYFHNTNSLHQFSESLAYQMLENNPLELHYSIAHPEKLGYENISTNLIPFNENYYENASAYWSDHASALAKINRKFLSKENQFLYALLERHIQLQLNSLSFPYYENPLAMSNGIHSQLPILLSEYTFYDKEDIENYFVLLSQIPEYLNGLYTYAYKKELNGLSLYTPFLEEISNQCMELFPQKSLEQGTHFLQTSFKERVAELFEQNIITKTEQISYIDRNTALIKQTLVPAYQKLALALQNIKGTDVLLGLNAYPNGKSYYEYLLKTNTGSAKSVKEIQQMLYDRYDTLCTEYQSLLAQETLVQNLHFPIVSPKEMVAHLHMHSQNDFPSVNEFGAHASQKVELKNVHGALANMSAPAFYMTPPIDKNDTHTIYVNPSSSMRALDLYTTLAHEGFPGHLYQTVYSQTALRSANAPLIRHLLYHGGFTEGWAIYAEFYSYQYAQSACNAELSDTLSLQRINRELQLCVCSILDIYIHYEGADLEKTKALLQTLGLNVQNAESIYEIICDAPANYPKYYVGYLEILNLQMSAKTLWNENYSDYRFHKWLLGTGGGDYKNLGELLQ